MGRPNPVEKFPLLYINRLTKKLTQIQKLSPERFRIKGHGKGQDYITRDYLHKHYDFYGVIDRFGIVIKYRKEGRAWKRDYTTSAAFDPLTKKWKSAKESEQAIIDELNKMNKRNPELAFYDPNTPGLNMGLSNARNDANQILAERGEDPLWQEV